MEEIFVGIDIGGSHIGIGYISNTSFSLIKPIHSIKIDGLILHPKKMIKLIKDELNNFIEDTKSIKAIGIGCPGQSKNGIIVAAANFPFFVNAPLASLMSESFNNIPVILLNDADAILASLVWSSNEFNLYKNIAMISLGTGIGFSLILDNKLYQGSNGLIEGGHMIVNSSRDNSKNVKCGCGQYGCIEMYASAKNTGRIYTEMVSENGANNGTHFNAKDVFDKLHQGDGIALRVIDEISRNLAVMCINVCRIVDPDIIIFAGGMSNAGSYLIDKIKKQVKELTWTVLATDVIIMNASASDDAGVIGVALAAKQHYYDKFKNNESKELIAVSETQSEVVIDQSIHLVNNDQITHIKSNNNNQPHVNKHNYETSEILSRKTIKSIGIIITYSSLTYSCVKYVSNFMFKSSKKSSLNSNKNNSLSIIASETTNIFDYFESFSPYFYLAGQIVLAISLTIMKTTDK
eukprot:gene7488-10203_t